MSVHGDSSDDDDSVGVENIVEVSQVFFDLGEVGFVVEVGDDT